METELLAATRQTLWGRLAVANFFLGGTGAGLYVMAASEPGFAVGLAVGPLLALAGFLCVAAEAGRPLRGLRVLRMVKSSWMSRELWAGGAFIVCSALDLFLPWIGFRILAWFAAVILIIAQGSILSQSRGVAAWDVPLMPFVFLTSGLASGAGLLGIVSAARGGGESTRIVWETAALILLSGGGWIGYLVWRGDPAFRLATAPLRRGSAVARILGVGHLLPLLLLTLGSWFPGFLIESLVLAGAGILIGALDAKAGLVLRAGQLRPVTIPSLRVRFTGSR